MYAAQGIVLPHKGLYFRARACTQRYLGPLPNLNRCHTQNRAPTLYPLPGVHRELRCIAGALPSSRQTLLFSATMTSNLQALESLALTNPVKYDLTKKVRYGTVR